MNLTRLAMYKKMFGGSSSGGGGGSSGGGASNVKEKDVNFYDYDGTLLHSYTVEEAQALSELPELPTQEGLICQGWNWSLDDIKAHNRAVDVGATYITDDGKTRLYIKIAAEGRMDVPLYFSQTVANGVTINWGDGSATETLDGTGNVNTTHAYASIGEYVISLDVADGCTISLGHGSSSYCVMGITTSNSNKIYRDMLRKVEIGKSMMNVRSYGFQSCSKLQKIAIPNGMDIGDRALMSTGLKFVVYSKTYLSTYALKSASLERISLPYCVRTLEEAISNCNSLTKVTMPNTVTRIATRAFQYCRSLTRVIMSNKVTSIQEYTFDNCAALKIVDFTQNTSVPTLTSTLAFQEIASDCEIRVPAALYDEWKAATNWSALASKIVGV